MYETSWTLIQRSIILQKSDFVFLLNWKKTHKKVIVQSHVNEIMLSHNHIRLCKYISILLVLFWNKKSIISCTCAITKLVTLIEAYMNKVVAKVVLIDADLGNNHMNFVSWTYHIVLKKGSLKVFYYLQWLPLFPALSFNHLRWHSSTSTM